LFIDGKKVVDNDGAHGVQERSGTVTLSKGPHLIRVEYFQGGGGKSLAVRWRGPGVEKQPVPADVLTHKPDAATATKDVEGHYRVHVGKWFVMRDGEFAITSAKPDLPADELRWRAWAAAHRINKGPYWPYDAVRDHGKILENIDATPAQKRAIDEIVRIAREGGEAYEKETTPRYRELGALADKAKEAGDEEKADKYKKMQHVQVHGKLALKRAPFFEILSLLTDEQWDALIKAMPKYRELRDGMGAMKEALEASAQSEVSLRAILAGRDGRQLLQRKSDGALFYLEMPSGKMVQVHGATVKRTKYDAWRGGINWDGRRFLYQNGTTIHVVNDDGSGRKALVEGANPHWWRDQDSGADYVVYNQDASMIPCDGDGTGGPATMRIPVEGGQPEEIWPHCYDAGLSKDGTHIGESYKGAFIGDRSTGRIFGNLPPDKQHCVGSMLPDNTYRLLYEKSTAHRHVVIANKEGEIVWSFSRIGSGDIFAETSPNHPDFCIVSSSDTKRYYLVQISTKHYADLGVSLDEYGRIGGPWVGRLPN
jgi:hypothetical protein